MFAIFARVSAPAKTLERANALVNSDAADETAKARLSPQKRADLWLMAALYAFASVLFSHPFAGANVAGPIGALLILPFVEHCLKCWWRVDYTPTTS